MVAALAESVAEQKRNVLIVTSQNSAADSAIDKLNDSKYMVVRAHALGLERRTMMQAISRVEQSYAKDQDEDLEPASNDHDLEPDSNMQAITMRVTADLMKMCEEVYLAKESILRSVDPRMQKLKFAIHTWMLKLAGVVPSKWSLQPTRDQVKAGARDEWAKFRMLWTQMKSSRLEDEDWETIKGNLRVSPVK